jgi:hypothetical protein
MASGQTLFTFPPQANQPPAADYATPDTRNGIFVLDFDATTDESAVFVGVLPRDYAGSGLTVTIHAMHSTAVAGNSRWQAQIERMNTDEDADSFAAAQSGTIAASATSGIITSGTIAFTDGAQMDSLAAGEPFRLKITRDADGTSGTDDATGDAELVTVEVRES